MNRRAAVALVALIVLLVFLLAQMQVKLDREHADRVKYQSGLAASQQSIVDKLTEVFTQEIQKETAYLEKGQTPPQRLQDIIDKLKGIDPALIKQAVQQAYSNVAHPTTTTTRPATTTTTARPTTTTARATTTTSEPPQSTTTTTKGKPTTTTTTRCTVGVLGLCLIGR